MARTWKDKTALSVIVLLAMGGAVVCALVLAAHVGGWTASGEGTSFVLKLCGESPAPGGVCADIINSRFGSFDVYLGERRFLFPTSLFGLAYFLAIGFLFAFAIRPPLTDRWIRWPLLGLVTTGLCASLVLVGVMAFSLDAWCRLCVIAHGCSASIFVATVWLLRRTVPASERGGTQSVSVVGLQRRLVLCGLAGSLAVSAAVWLYFDASSEARRQWRKVKGYAGTIAELQQDPQFVLREYFASPVVDVPGLPDQAESDALPDLLLYTDLSSSACKCFDEQWTQHYSEYFEDGIRVRYGHLSEGDADVTPALLALAAAKLQGGDEASSRMRGLLFDNWADGATLDFEALALAAGLDGGRLLKDIDDGAARKVALAELELAHRLGVDAAPAAFFNGRRVPDLCMKSPVFWREIARIWRDEQATESSYAAAIPTPSEEQ